MRLGKRNIVAILSAIVQTRHYLAAINMRRVYKHPFDAFRRYLLGCGEYPAKIVVKTPDGPLALTLYSYHDMLTMNEVFCRLDYQASVEDSVIVDFGSNIGISAAYFLTAVPNSFVYLFEPLGSNIARLRRNLSSFEGRFALEQTAVGLSDGDVEFGWEETGRYGGVGMKTGQYVSVPCRDSNRVLEEIIARHGRIDILKIDIETLERELTERIPFELAERIGRIYVESAFETNPLERTHEYRQCGSIARFVLRR